MTQVMGRQTITTTELSARLGVKVDAKFMTDELNIPPDVRTKTGNFWFEDKFCYICYELSQYFFGLHMGDE